MRRRAPAAGACTPDSRGSDRATRRHWGPRRRRAAASSERGRGWLPRRRRASRVDSAASGWLSDAGGQRLWMRWLTSAPAAISNCALRCRRSRNSGTRNRLECAIATSGGNRSGPPGRLTHDRIGLRRLPQRAFVADRAGEVGIAGDQFGIIGQDPQRDARICAIGRAADIAGIDQLAPMQDANGALLLRRRLHFHVTLQVGPGYEPVFARDARLRVVQAQCQR